MGIDLSYWKYKPGVRQNDQAVYQAASNGKLLNELEEIPIKKIIQKIEDIFSKDWKKLDHESWENDEAIFQIMTTKQFIRFDLYDVLPEDMVEISEIMEEFDCYEYAAVLDESDEDGDWNI